MEPASLEQRSRGLWSNPFLDRVRRRYKLALTISDDHYGRMWRVVDQHRAHVYVALLPDTGGGLGKIFADAAAGDLFNGIAYLRRNVMEATLGSGVILAGS